MLYLDHKSIAKGVVHFTPNAVYTLSGILISTINIVFTIIRVSENR
jgi:hypothetical protein